MRWRGFSHYSKSQYETALLTYLYDFFFLPIQKYGQMLVWSYTYIDDTQDVEGFMIVNYVTTLALLMSLQDIFRWQQQNIILARLKNDSNSSFSISLFQNDTFHIRWSYSEEDPSKEPADLSQLPPMSRTGKRFPRRNVPKNSFFLN